MENLQASESRYRELDMPQEVMQLTKHQILSISVTAMLAHAQVQPESVIPLPRNTVHLDHLKRFMRECGRFFGLDYSNNPRLSR